MTVAGLVLGALGFVGGCESPELLDGRSEINARYRPVALSVLPGWSRDHMDAALPAFLRSCEKFSAMKPGESVGPRAIGSRVGDWQAACAAARMVPRGDSEGARRLFTEHFQAWEVTGPNGPTGTFTGYYEATLDGSFERTALYNTPVYGPPRDLRMDGAKGMRDRNGTLEPYPDRAAIETGAITGLAPVLLWARDPVDVHMLHIQGSGQVRLPDGRVQRIGYAANNGHRFVGVGRLMKERGFGDGASMPAIRAWLRANPDQGIALMRENPRFIFFRFIDGAGPIGAQGVPLTPERSLAVDKRSIPLGAPVWLATTDAQGQGIQRLMVAQDTGNAITGAVRGDFFWGGGEQALYHAGGRKSPGRYWLLIPRSETLARRSPAAPFDPKTL
ncbi:MAG: murein transglycosylase A [Rhodospirillum sp.]|nr:murein transglycosylase A [Rhodospirillum sp.]